VDDKFLVLRREYTLLAVFMYSFQPIE